MLALNEHVHGGWNAYLAMKYFGKNNQAYYQFKIAASAALTQFESTKLYQTRQLNVSSEQPLHYTEKLPYSKDCFYCQHGYGKPRVQENTTTFKCVTCNIAICKPTKGKCKHLHCQRTTKETTTKRNRALNMNVLDKNVNRKKTKQAV